MHIKVRLTFMGLCVLLLGLLVLLMLTWLTGHFPLADNSRPEKLSICKKTHICLQDEFIFRVEGTGALDCSTIINQALDILCNKLRGLRTNLNTSIANNPEDMEEG